MAASPALAAPIAPGALVPALDVFVDAIADGHTVAACAPAKSPARDEANWASAKAVLVATLWASGFPIDFVRTVGQRLDASVPSAKPDCSNPVLLGDLALASADGWVKAVERPLAGMDLKIIDNPLSPTAWAAIKADFAKETTGQQRMLSCIAVIDPAGLPQVVHDWDQMILGIGQKLVDAGLPRDEVSAQLSAAEANSIWHRVAPDAEAELRDSCVKDKVWFTRFTQFDYSALTGQVDKLLAPASAGGGK
ncbi:MAG TPA: hypothetical protein VL418_09495 [Devosiaceae bacterium]|nr:hypothetical protein [Devosiaceae bacterium]